MNSFPYGYRALVIGGSGAIGAALVARLREDPKCAHVRSVSRDSELGLDFNAPATVAEAAQALREEGPWHLVIVATGMLQGPTGGPEKRLADLEAPHMAASFAVPLSARHARRVGLRRDRAAGGRLVRRADRAHHAGR